MAREVAKLDETPPGRSSAAASGRACPALVSEVVDVQPLETCAVAVEVREGSVHLEDGE